jgi:hypothetical protein
MKYSVIIALLVLCVINVPAAQAITVTSDGDATITVGERVDLNWDWQNANNRIGTNTYGDTLWNYNPVPAPSKISYATNHFMNPGVYSFRFDYVNNNSLLAEFDQAWLTVLPAAPVSLNTVTINPSGTVATLTWAAGAGASGARVRVTDPAGIACPSGWTTISSTVCERVVSGNSTTFETVPNTTYLDWTVYSRASTLESLVGVTSSTSFTSTVTAAVNLNFR